MDDQLALDLPSLDPDYDVTAEDIAAVQANGHVSLRGVLSPAEAAAYRAALLDATSVVEPLVPTPEEGEVYRKAFRQHTNLWKASDAAARFVHAPRFARIAAELLGVDGIRLYHDQALFKEPGGGHTPWHQDMHYWPLDRDLVITMWMPLVDITPEMGELVFVAGSHREGAMTDLPISDRSDAAFDRLVVERNSGQNRTGLMCAGDASFHLAWTLHSATANATDRTREVMTVIFFADGLRLSEPDNDGRRSDLATWFPGLAPGDAAASELTPLLYSR